MKIQRLTMICQANKCDHEFRGEVVVECPVQVALASMKALRCPKCGSRNLAIQLSDKKERR